MSKDIRSFFNYTSEKLKLDSEVFPSEKASSERANPPQKLQAIIEKKYDVGNFIDKTFDDAIKLELLQNIWKPERNYKFPLLEKFSERKLRFRHQWLDEYAWLAYSEVKNGAFCIPCVAFASVGGIGSQSLGQLVRKPFDNWKKASEVFKDHQQKLYHLKAIADRDMFLKVMQDSTMSIENRLNKGRMKQIVENRKCLGPIIEAVIILGRQEIALRGHRDNGFVGIQNDFSGPNKGNFRALLSYRALGDSNLRAHLEKPSERTKYTSPSIQNEIIDAAYIVLTRKVIAKVIDAQFFSVLVDETSDVSLTEQVTICIRYIQTNESLKCVVNEDFLIFCPTTSTKGIDLAQMIVNNLRERGLNTRFLIGQGYDGARNMNGVFKGVQAVIRSNFAPYDLYVHCSAHCLNLSICTASNLPAIKSCLLLIEKIYLFFNTPKRSSILKNIIESNSSVKKKTLKRLNLTRWVAKYEAVRDFYEIFENIYKALDEMQCEEPNAKLLKNAIDFEFIIALKTVVLVYEYSLPLSLQFQKKNIDLVEAISLADDAQKLLDNIRSNEESFKEIFISAKSLAENLDISIKLTRYQAKSGLSTEKYYRIKLFNEFIDYYNMELKERFTNHKKVLSGFQRLFDDNLSDNDLKDTLEFYEEFFNCSSSTAMVEVKLWRQFLKSKGVLPKNALDAIDTCPKETFPNINILLSILATLPVSTSTAERTFSCMKRIKTFLRNSTGQNRLNGLAALAIHKNVPIYTDEVLNELSKRSRRLNIAL